MIVAEAVIYALHMQRLRRREGTGRDIQASGQMPGSAEVTLTCKVGDGEPKGIPIESPPPITADTGEKHG